jgi:hypothetical protein
MLGEYCRITILSIIVCANVKSMRSSAHLRFLLGAVFPDVKDDPTIATVFPDVTADAGEYCCIAILWIIICAM